MVGLVDREQYRALEKQFTPRPPVLENAGRAFAAGGIVSVLGQVVIQAFISLMGLSPEAAATPAAVVLITLAAVLTSAGVWDKFAQWAGMGASVPITGFANAIVAPAMEFKRDGWVFGVGAKMFSIAGPVIVYGLLTAVLAGSWYYLMYFPR